MIKKSTTTKKASKDQTKHFKGLWLARVELVCNGFLTDAENKKVIKRLESYQKKNNIVITNKELLS